MAIPISRGGIDYPDFHTSVMFGDTTGDISLSELAVRLQSGINYSRGGNIVYADNFDGGLGNWLRVGSDTPSTPTLVSNPVQNGHYAASLQYSPDGNWTSYIAKYIAIPSSTAFGVTFSFNTLNTIQEFEVYYYLITTQRSITVQLKISTNNNVCWLKDSNGQWQDIGHYYLTLTDASIYYYWKVLIVPQLKVARYVNINEISFDTHEILLPSGGGLDTGSLFIRYMLKGESTDLEQIFIDNVYISAQEEG